MARWRLTPALVALIGFGVAARIALALLTDSFGGDVYGFSTVNVSLRHDGLDVYGHVNSPSTIWPYPPAFFAWVLGAGRVGGMLGISFDHAFRFAPALADGVLAWVVQDFVGRRGASDRQRLGAAALVALGPSFFVISGYHGQFDSVAILPAAIALSVWDRGGGHRAPLAGVLIGTGAAVKTAPLLLLLALLPTVRSRREGWMLLGAALAVPVAVTLPFLAATPAAVSRALRYHGLPGIGGLSLIVQPSLIDAYLAGRFPLSLSGVSRALYDHGALLTLAALATAGAWLARRRVAPAEAALVIWLVFYVGGINFFFQYAVWGLPFLIMAGRLRSALLVELALAAPMAVVYLSDLHDPRLGPAYAVYMGALWLLLAATLVVVLRRWSRAPRAA